VRSRSAARQSGSRGCGTRSTEGRGTGAEAAPWQARSLRSGRWGALVSTLPGAPFTFATWAMRAAAAHHHHRVPFLTMIPTPPRTTSPLTNHEEGNQNTAHRLLATGPSILELQQHDTLQSALSPQPPTAIQNPHPCRRAAPFEQIHSSTHCTRAHTDRLGAHRGDLLPAPPGTLCRATAPTQPHPCSRTHALAPPIIVGGGRREGQRSGASAIAAARQATYVLDLVPSS
jgi:hypothetical protein